MPDPRAPLENAVASYDRATDKEFVAAAERERKEVLERFPLDQWPTMPLERYALGQKESEDTFSRWMEFRTQHLGSMRGGSARKHIIYKHKDKPGWYFDPEYKDEQEAWLKVREAFVQAFHDASVNDWNAIDDLAPLAGGPALCLKALHLYFPKEILPVYSQQHLRHFLRILERPEAGDRSLDAVRLNRTLLAYVIEHPAFRSWSGQEVMRFLYRWADPREERRIVKIAPGEDAKYWDDCLREGYICVGWDKVGDLREFPSKEAFRAQFDKEFAGTYNNHKPTLSKKANEVWTLMELEPGDIVIANKGTSQILAVGALAWLLLDGLGTRDLLAPGKTHCFAFLIDMNRLFEMFVFRLINQLLAGTGLHQHYQRGDRSIIVNASTNEPYARVVPDLLVEANDPTVAGRVAVDAKYKLYDQRKLDSGDVYQSFLYAYAFSGAGAHAVPAALLLYPSSTRSSQAVRLRVRTAQTSADAEILALGFSIPEALAEVTHGVRGPVTQTIIEAIQQGMGSRTVAA